MGKPVRKYKIVSAVYLSLAIISGSIGAYSALPSVVEDNSSKSNNLKDVLDDSTPEDKVIISTTNKQEPKPTSVTTVASGGDVNPSTDGLFEWKDPQQVPTATPKPTVAPVVTPKPTVAPVAPQATPKPVTTQQTTANKDNTVDPFESLTDPFAATNNTKEPTPTKAPTQTPTPTKAPTSNTKPQATPVPTGASDSTTNTSQSTDISMEVLQSTLAGMTDRVDVSKQHDEFELMDLDVVFRAKAMTSASKDRVNRTYSAIPVSEYYTMKYNTDLNIIVIEFIKELPKEGLSLNTIFNMETIDIKTFGNESESLLKINNVSGKATVNNVAGYNGFSQLAINNVAVVLMNSTSIEPLVTENIKQDVIKHFEELSKVTDSNTGDNHGNDSENTPNVNPGTPDLPTYENDYNNNSSLDDFFVDYNDGQTQDSTQDQTNNQNSEVLDQIKDDLVNKKDQNSNYKPVWGVAEKDTTTLKNNISDGKEVVSKDGVKLNVIDITGNQIDLKDKTEKTKPAEIKGHSLIKITQEEVDKELPVSFYVAILISILSLLMYLYYTSLYQKEYRRNLETRGLLGNVEVDEFSYSNIEIGDSKDEIEYIDTEAILLSQE